VNTSTTRSCTNWHCCIHINLSIKHTIHVIFTSFLFLELAVVVMAAAVAIVAIHMHIRSIIIEEQGKEQAKTPSKTRLLMSFPFCLKLDKKGRKKKKKMMMMKRMEQQEKKMQIEAPPLLLRNYQTIRLLRTQPSLSPPRPCTSR